ncbi:hypothetical protein DV736_g3632, partial [Chaetothyriales sp. CBS 134916]
MEITEYSSRKAVAEVDCVAVCPTYPEYLIYGTYSLVKRREDQEIAAQIRSGTIQALPVSSSFKPNFAGGSRPPKLCQHSFAAAVLDIRFHPNDGSLLGVALSDGTIHFFRFVKRADVLNRCWVTELFPLGHAVVEREDPVTGLIPVVTQFQWLPALHEVGRRDVSNTFTLTIAASLDSGKVKMLRAKIPAIKSSLDQRLLLPPALLQAPTSTIHTHTLEAWCAALVAVPNFPNMHVLLSGADDSTLIASIFTLMDPASSLSSSKMAKVDLYCSDTPPPTVCFTDRRCHEAGVTAILPLPSPPPPSKGSSSPVPAPVPIPILTGSYDENIRLFCLSPTSHKLSRQPLASLALCGGVWRLQLMDHYAVVVAAPQPDAKALLRYQQHYIILVSCMHAGARILRVVITTYHDNDGEGEWKWESDIQMEAVFGRGHDTIVYACDFVVVRRPKTKRVLGMAYGGGLDGHSMSVQEDEDGEGKEKGKKEGAEEEKEGAEEGKEGGKERKEDVGRYTVVSTGFYDRSICNWTWKDEMRQRAVDCGSRRR